MRNRQGSGMVDAMVALMLLALAGLFFSATFPSAFKAIRQGGETKKAVELAQMKIEQVKTLNYESIGYTNLVAANLIDAEQSTSPYSFTSVDNLTSSLASATGTLTVTDNGSGTKHITVVVGWDSGGVNHNVTLNTYVADKRPWGES